MSTNDNLLKKKIKKIWHFFDKGSKKDERC